MNIRLGIYEIFARIVPGGFYLVALNCSGLERKLPKKAGKIPKFARMTFSELPDSTFGKSPPKFTPKILRGYTEKEAKKRKRPVQTMHRAFFLLGASAIN